MSTLKRLSKERNRSWRRYMKEIKDNKHLESLSDKDTPKVKKIEYFDLNKGVEFCVPQRRYV